MTINRTHSALLTCCILASACSSSNELPVLGNDTLEEMGNIEILSQDPITSDAAMLIPNFPAGSDTERLLIGINQQVASTLLALNASLSEGTDLTEQQDECLASYDPAAGQQLLEIICMQPLATGDVPIYVEQASYYDTDECNAALFNGNTDGCLLESARLSIPTQWVIPESATDSSTTTPARPQPIAGVEVFYALNNTEYLRLESTEAALTGVFRCDINLRSNESTATEFVQSCASTIELAANRFDTLLAE